MLVLTRKPGEMLRIGNDICIRIVELRGRRVRIGIEAPASVRVAREEVLSPTADLHGAAKEAAGPATKRRRVRF